MANSLAAPAPAPKVGWSGQPAVTIPKAGLVITPGAGLVGRTQAGVLLLDNGTDAAAEPVNFFTPGLVTARTIGKWRNRRASGLATLQVMEANFGTAPTAGDGTNFWKVVCTDSTGANVVMPISTNGVSFYELDRSGGFAVIDPWTGQSTVAGAGDTGHGFRHPFIPSQAMTVGAFTFKGAVQSSGASFSQRVRGQLWRQEADATWTNLGTSYVQSVGGHAPTNALAETWIFRLPSVVPLVSGTRYAITVDMFEAYVVGTQGFPTTTFSITAPAPDGFGTTPNGGVPANVNPTGTTGNATIAANGATGNAGIDAAHQAAIRALTWDALAAVIPGASSPDFTINASITSVGMWVVNGTTSGVAPVFGDLTWSLVANGAPAAGAAGADLNLRSVLLP